MPTIHDEKFANKMAKLVTSPDLVSTLWLSQGWLSGAGLVFNKTKLCFLQSYEKSITDLSDVKSIFMRTKLKGLIYLFSSQSM